MGFNCHSTFILVNLFKDKFESLSESASSCLIWDLTSSRQLSENFYRLEWGACVGGNHTTILCTGFSSEDGIWLAAEHRYIWIDYALGLLLYLAPFWAGIYNPIWRFIVDNRRPGMRSVDLSCGTLGLLGAKSFQLESLKNWILRYICCV